MSTQVTIPESNPFRVYFDIIKSVPQKDGRIRVAGIASDGSDDAEGEVVLTSLNPSSLNYLNQYGKFGYNHLPGVVIGDITKAQFISPEDAHAKYGVELIGQGVEVEGWIHPLDEKYPLPELQETHRLFNARSKVGLSLEAIGPRGMVRLKDGTERKVAIPTFIPVVAVTPLPINTNSLCIMKSFAGMMSGEFDEPDKTPVYICPTLKPTINKGLNTTGMIATDGTTGGDALKLQELGGRGSRESEKEARTCCKRALPEGARYCSQCGERYRSFGQQTRMIKALLEAAEIVSGTQH